MVNPIILEYAFLTNRPTFRILHILGPGGAQERDGHSKDDGHG